MAQLRLHSRVMFTCLALVAIVIAALSSRVFAQDGGTVVKVTAPAKASPDAEVRVLVDITDVKNIGGFQFVLTVDSNVLKPLSAAKGEFLGSSGREVFCPDPTVDGESVLLKCVTLRDQPTGADGSGTLATISLKSEGLGASDLALSHVRVLEPDGTEIPVTTQDSRLTISGRGGSSFGTWLIVGGVVVAAIVIAVAGGALLMRR